MLICFCDPPVQNTIKLRKWRRYASPRPSPLERPGVRRKALSQAIYFLIITNLIDYQPVPSICMLHVQYYESPDQFKTKRDYPPVLFCPNVCRRFRWLRAPLLYALKNLPVLKKVRKLLQWYLHLRQRPWQ